MLGLVFGTMLHDDGKVSMTYSLYVDTDDLSRLAQSKLITDADQAIMGRVIFEVPDRESWRVFISSDSDTTDGIYYLSVVCEDPVELMEFAIRVICCQLHCYRPDLDVQQQLQVAETNDVKKHINELRAKLRYKHGYMPEVSEKTTVEQLFRIRHCYDVLLERYERRRAGAGAILNRRGRGDTEPM